MNLSGYLVVTVTCEIKLARAMPHTQTNVLKSAGQIINESATNPAGAQIYTRCF